MPIPGGPAKSPSEALALAGGTLYVHNDVVSPGSVEHRWRQRARLLGGPADERSIELETLIDSIAVYLLDGTMIACDRALPHSGEGHFVGTYRLATGSGPEPPVYVVAV
jgi:hypothetical protein